MSSNFTEKSNEIAPPVPVTNNYLFKLRLLFDLQLSTIYKLLIPHISKPPKTWSQSKNHSYLIDIGVGNDPWNKYIHPGFTKINLEVPALLEFNMNNILDTIIYDGSKLPLKNDFVDTVLLIEVLEHVEYPDKLLKEIHRVLLPNGRLIMSVPFSARRHHIPFDYRRYTKEGLIKLLEANSFHIELLTERGNDLAAIFNKLLIYQISLFKKITFKNFLLNTILFLIISIFTISFYILTKVPMLNRTGNLTDPLGYFLVAKKI